jgi:hypothetical protein
VPGPCSRRSTGQSGAAAVRNRGLPTGSRRGPQAVARARAGSQRCAAPGAHFHACAASKPRSRPRTRPGSDSQPRARPQAGFRPSAASPACIEPLAPFATYLPRAATARASPKRLGSIRIRLGPRTRLPEFPPAAVGKTRSGSRRGANSVRDVAIALRGRLPRPCPRLSSRSRRQRGESRPRGEAVAR